MNLYRIRDVAPFLRKDLLLTENVHIEDFVISIVKDLYDTEDPLPILRRILDCTTQIANGKIPPCKAGGEQAVAEKIPIIISKLRSCKVTGETDRYAPFVESSNAGLSVLQHVKIDGIPDLDINDMYFLRHDPTEIVGHHHMSDFSNRRKPDVTATSRAIAKQVFSQMIALSEDTLDKLAPKPTPVALSWEHVFNGLELKRKKTPDGLKAQLAALDGPYTAPYTTASTTEGTEAASMGELEDIFDEFDRLSSRGPPLDTTRSVQADVGQSAESSRERKRGRSPAPDRATKHVEVDIEDQAHPVIQVFGYGAEMMNAGFDRAHAMNWLITDTVVHLWYFDREGPIQTSGFDFVLQLPYFLAFLYLLQRFQAKHWGFIPQMRSDGTGVRYRTPGKDGEESIFSMEGPRMHTYTYGLGGRCTRTKKGTFTHDQRKGILKLSFPEISRQSESVIIKEAAKRCREDKATLACLPEVVYSQDFDDFSTSRIRKRLGIKLVDKRARTARALFFVRYKPITKLTSDWKTFMSSFWELLYTHATLWIRGIEHGDISERNLYYELKRDGSIQPKLCDYDLSHIAGQERPAGASNTGTRRFQAAELLKNISMIGYTAKVFRHDCESFAWVLIWILGRYNGGKLIEKPDFETWKDPSYLRVSAAREEFRDEHRKKLFLLRNTGLPNGLFQRAFIFLDLFYGITSEIDAAGREEFAAEAMGDGKRIAELKEKVAELDTLPDTMNRVTQSLLFAMDGGAECLKRFEALPQKVLDVGGKA
ncbi:hypothetical protein AAF712_014045 [Marasmius tenuissimus]|uniref:Fungal-type protein kinase domain-containing protein n=1 Tax=Marasmius tenuissimus TaxID=585030 RepID=A0ABR2ZC44_9AGAR